MCNEKLAMQNVTVRCNNGFVQAFVDNSVFYVFIMNYRMVKGPGANIELQTEAIQPLPSSLHFNHKMLFSESEDAEQFEAEWANFKVNGMKGYRPAAELSDMLGIWNPRSGCWQNYQCKFTTNSRKLSGQMLSGKELPEIVLTPRVSYVEGDFDYKDRSRHGQPYVIRVYTAPKDKDAILIAFPTVEKMEEWTFALFYAATTV